MHFIHLYMTIYILINMLHVYIHIYVDIYMCIYILTMYDEHEDISSHAQHESWSWGFLMGSNSVSSVQSVWRDKASSVSCNASTTQGTSTSLCTPKHKDNTIHAQKIHFIHAMFHHFEYVSPYDKILTWNFRKIYHMHTDRIQYIYIYSILDFYVRLEKVVS